MWESIFKMMNEKDIMLQVQAGQLDKLAVLYENNKGKLFNYFRNKGNNSAQSEDLVQETFMKILAYRTSFNGSSTFSSWMYGIARNTAADVYRKNKGSVVHEDIDEHEMVSEHCATENAVSVQQQDIFDQSLANISSEHREIIILSRFQQLNYHEISSLLDCNLNTLKSKMRNAISKLHEQYNKLSGEVQ